MITNELNLVNIDYEWVTEANKLLNEKNLDINIYDLISSQLAKLPHFNTPITLNTVAFLHNKLKKTDTYISTIFFKAFTKNFNKNASDFSLLPTELKIEMIVNELLDKEYSLDIENVLVKYDIDKNTFVGQQTFFEIAKLIAQKSPLVFIKNIEKFEITDQAILTNIAKSIAIMKPLEFLHNIEKFKISDQAVLLELAKSMVLSDDFSMSIVIAHEIERFGIKDPKDLIDIAKLIAEKNPNAIIHYINNFGLQEEGYIEIAKSIAKKNHPSLIPFIEHFKIKKDNHIEILKLLVKTDSNAAIHFIKHFGMKIEDLIEIAQSIAQKDFLKLAQDTDFLARYMETFSIKKEGLKEIVKSIALKEPNTIAEYIYNFKIKDPQAIIDIALIIAIKNSNALPKYIQKLGIDYTSLKGQQILYEIFKNVFYTNLASKTTTSTKRSLIWLETKLKTLPWDKPLQRMRLWQWIMKIMGVGSVEENRRFFIEQQPLIQQISKLEPKLRDHLTQIYIDLSPDQKKILVELQNTLYAETTNARNDKNINKKLPYLQLSIMIFATFSSVEKEEYLKVLRAIAIQRDTIRIGKNQKLLLETLLKIENSTFNEEKKLQLLNLLFNSSNWDIDNFRLVSDLLSFQAEIYFEKNNINFLKGQLEIVFKDKFDIKIENFSAKYEKTIGTWRNKEALTTYASKLNELNKEEKEQTHQLLKEVLQSVLESCFQKNRYRTENNPHMKEIENSHPSIFLNWQKGCQLDISETQTSKKEDIIIEKLHTSLETLKKIFKDIPNEGLAFYKIDLEKVEEELAALQPELELASKESTSIKESIEFVSQEIKKLKTLKKNKEAKEVKIEQKKAELINLRKELDLTQKFKPKETLLKALSNPNPENLTHLQNLINKEIEFYKTHEEIIIALKEFSKSIKGALRLWRPKAILAEEEFDKVWVPVKEGLENLISKDPTRYLHLQYCLKNKGKIERSLEQIEAELNALNLKSQTTKKQKEIQEERLYYLKEKALLEVLKKPEIKKLESLRSLFNKEKDVFYAHIEKALTLSKQLSKSYDITVIDTDDPNHFLLMGTEVEKSCQHVEGDADLTKCLLSHFLDGKNRLALVCDPNGKILARSVLRLLINDQGQPVLFQEKLYGVDNNSEYNALIRKIAKKKAEILGIPLLVSKKDFSEDIGKNYSFDLYAKNKPVPFEYVDALDGPQLASYTLKKEDIIQV